MLEKPNCNSKEFMKKEWNFLHIFIPLIKKMTRERMCIIDTFCSFFEKMYSSNCLIWKNYCIIFLGDCTWSEKSPLHSHETSPASMESWKYLDNSPMISHIGWIITMCWPYSSCNISREDICHIDIHAFRSSSHEKCIVENESFQGNSVKDLCILWIFPLKSKKNPYTLPCIR